MADAELKEALKDLPGRCLNLSIEERPELFQNVSSVLDNPGMNTQIVRGICKVIGTTLIKYKDPLSQKLVKDLIVDLLQHHPDFAFEHMNGVFKALVSKELPAAPLVKGSQAAVFALGWSSIVLTNCQRETDVGKVELLKLIEYQSGLYQLALLSGNKKVSDKAYAFLKEGWLQIPDIYRFYFDKLLTLEPTCGVMVLMCAILRFVQEECGDSVVNGLVSENKNKLIDCFVKSLITAKTKPNVHHITACQLILRSLSKKEFQTHLLPSLQRSMLRNPEIILQGVGAIVNELEIDLSDFSMDMGKILIQNLYSKNDVARIESLDSLKCVALKCGDVKAIEALLKQIFAVLNGADGKITVVEYRINLLQGVGHLSYNKIPVDAIKPMLPTVIELFTKSIETEIQEKVLCHTLDIFGLWSQYIHGDIPKKLVELFRKGLDAKTAQVRIAYLQWLLACLANGKLAADANLNAPLMKLFEKAVQNPIQIPVVSEGVCAACIILLTNSRKDDTSGGVLSVFWTNLLDMNKQIFVADKFISSAQSDILCYVMLMCKEILLKYFDDIKGSPDCLYKGAVYSLTSPSAKTRTYCYKLAYDLVTSPNGASLSKYLLLELTAHIEVAKIHGDEQIVANGDDHNNSVPAQGFIDAIEVLNSASANPETTTNSQIQDLALSSLLCSHHPSIVQNRSDLWEQMLKKTNLNAKSFIVSKKTNIVDVIMTNYRPSLMYENALSTLIRISPEAILPHLVEQIIEELRKPAMSEVTDSEYFTYLTPDGELYDKSVLPNADEIFKQSAHLKRENKAYSYKEQVEELQLRRELEEKWRREGKATKPAPLTQKQRDAIRQQTEKESCIKARLKELDANLKKIVSQLMAASKGNPQQLSFYFATLLPAILKMLNSPLAAAQLSKLYYDLREITFEARLHELGRALSIATIRLYEPHCDLFEEWLKVDLNEMVVDTVVKLYSSTITKWQEDEEQRDYLFLLTAPAFSYAFQFIEKAVFMGVITSSDTHLLNLIQIVAKHAQFKGSSVDGADSQDFRHPKYMPRLAMMKLLMEIITSRRGRVQTQAVAAFLDVAASSSGKEFCARASKGEIEFLLTALQHNLEAVRDIGLRGLTAVMDALPTIYDDYDLGLRLTRRLWVAKHDLSEENKYLANTLWEDANFELPIVMCDELLQDIIHPEPCIQKAAAAAMVSILQEDASIIDGVLEQLLEIYHEKLILTAAVLDSFGREIMPSQDSWGPRRGVAFAICQICQFFTAETVNNIMQFMVDFGLRDREEVVHKEMLAASLAIVDIHGKESVAHLLPVFEEFLDKAPNVSSYDNIRQAVVILMGSLARHLDKDDERIQPILQKLITALSTPSQQVQEAVANCIPHLIPSVKDKAPQLMKKLLQQLVKGEKYGERRGAAYGIAGIVKGLGILSLKQLDIMTKLTAYIKDKSNPKSREGALLAFEMLCGTLGRLFEPYIVHVLPHLLQCFGDQSQHVRQAADDTAKVVMGKLSAHGVKLILPSLLNALDEDSWRTKTASAELLGAMAFCAPKQLSSCLPSIVPKLMEVLGDSHIKVQEAGAQALKVIGSVIKNPEIQAIVPILLRALQNPSHQTSACLCSLLETKFVHFIDAPSLALIMPVVQRAFMDRSTETRKMAAQIIGNMYSLTDQKDLTPYLPSIIPGLKNSLLDPVPEVRAVSSRALGAMVRGMGESSFEDLLPWLMQTLTSESSSVDRSGAAQGLSEVVGGLGVEKLHKIMPEVIATAERTDIAPHVKDGYIMMFIYMPSAFPNDFLQYIGQIINPILKALADENEYVRDTALKAGQRIVNLYAESAITLLLPELEKGLFDDNWRIRYSSVQLLGDLLYRISGVSGKMTTETASEDDNFGTEQSHKAILSSLGAERRNRVLAGLYMGRSDVSLMVRQAALHVWKVVVTNTPRTLREILPTLFSLLLGCLASTSYDKRQVAARTLGDLVRKLGERVLPEIIPILERGLNSEQADQRQGVCIGLSEIMASTSRDMVMTFVDSLVPTVRKALSDPLPEVRHAAARTFDSLHATVGQRALDDILPSMLEGLSDPDLQVAESTLDGLRQVMAIKSRVVLPYLIPQLTASPVNTKALSILASVAGEALTKYLPKILPAIMSALAAAQGTANENQEMEYCQAVILAVDDEVGVRTIMDTLMESTKSEKTEVRKASAALLCAFCTHSPGDYSQYVPQLLRGLLRLLADADKDVLQRAWDALNSVTKTLDSAQQIAHVTDVRQAVKYATSDLKGKDLPGFCLPKGITPLLPVFREAILNGLPEEKENAAQGLGEIIQLSSAASLQPSVVHITGPLIRILGDRFNAGVKASVLETLAILLHKVGVMLKQFLPQLQTTFLKALSDPSRVVRMKAGQALAELIVIHIRPDPLFTEIHNGIKNADDPQVRETMLQALRGLITPAGDKMTEPLRKQFFITLTSMLGHQEDLTRTAVGGCLGALCKWLSPEQLDDAMKNHILNDDFGEDWALRHGRTAALFVALKESPGVVYNEKYEIKICKTIAASITTTEKIPVALNGVRAAAYLLQYCMTESLPVPAQIVGPYVKSMNHVSNEVKQLLAKTCIYLAKNVPAERTSPDFLKPLIPTLVNGTKEKNGYVKSNSEIALIAILRLRTGEETYQKCVNLLEAGARDSLNEVVTKVLRKVAMQSVGKEEELDDTILS